MRRTMKLIIKPFYDKMDLSAQVNRVLNLKTSMNKATDIKQKNILEDQITEVYNEVVLDKPEYKKL